MQCIQIGWIEPTKGWHKNRICLDIIPLSAIYTALWSSLRHHYQFTGSPKVQIHSAFKWQTSESLWRHMPETKKNWNVLFLVEFEMIRWETVAEILVRTEESLNLFLKHLFTPLFLVSFNWNQLRRNWRWAMRLHIKWPMNTTTKTLSSKHDMGIGLLTFNLAGAFVSAFNWIFYTGTLYDSDKIAILASFHARGK